MVDDGQPLMLAGASSNQAIFFSVCRIHNEGRSPLSLTNSIVLFGCKTRLALHDGIDASQWFLQACPLVLFDYALLVSCRASNISDPFIKMKD